VQILNESWEGPEKTIHRLFLKSLLDGCETIIHIAIEARLTRRVPLADHCILFPESFFTPRIIKG
jgi:hypothetical protein